MQYNPHRVSRIERQAFQRVGDKVEQKIRQHKEMTQNERDSYWMTAVRREMKSMEVR